MNPLNPIRTFDSTLFKVAEETFGELAFMLVMPEENPEAPPPAEQWGHACGLDFTGPFGGKLFVAITPEMLEPLATNMLGIEPGEDIPNGVKLVDALKELLNVICGNLLPAIAGEEVIFHIGGPEELPTPELPESIDGQDFVGQVVMPLDSGVASIHFFVDSQADVLPPK